jgi:hypothetical protein
MIPPPRCRLATAPRFRLEADWAGRLAVGAGVTEADGRFFPRGPWRPLTAAELALLVPGPKAGGGNDAETGRLFQVPGHLRAAWWELLDQSVGAGDAALAGFDHFAGQVAEFLRFKRMEAPPGLQMEAVATAAGRCSMRSDPETGAPAGLGASLPPWAACPRLEAAALPRLWAVVNLGDEDSRLVLVAVSIQGLAADVALRHPDLPQPTTVGELVGWFLRTFPDIPPIRMRLGPGEGFRLPSGGLILDADATDKQEPDVLLLISEQAPA